MNTIQVFCLDENRTSNDESIIRNSKLRSIRTPLSHLDTNSSIQQCTKLKKKVITQKGKASDDSKQEMIKKKMSDVESHGENDSNTSVIFRQTSKAGEDMRCFDMPSMLTLCRASPIYESDSDSENDVEETEQIRLAAGIVQLNHGDRLLNTIDDFICNKKKNLNKLKSDELVGESAKLNNKETNNEDAFLKTNNNESTTTSILRPSKCDEKIKFWDNEERASLLTLRLATPIDDSESESDVEYTVEECERIYTTETFQLHEDHRLVSELEYSPYFNSKV